MFPALLLALAGLSPAGSVPDAHLEVLEGRASLAAVEGVSELRAGRAPRTVEGPGYLEVAPLSRVAIRWRQTGSLIVQGPATVEWNPGSDRLTWRFHEIAKTHVEVRSRDVRLELPGGWVAVFEHGASFLRSRPGGAVEFHHDAGLPVLLRAPTTGAGARPPWTVLAGARLLLAARGGRPDALAGSQGRLLAPYGRPESQALERKPAGHRWTGFSWPWRTPTAQPAAARAPAPVGPVELSAEPAAERDAEQVGTPEPEIPAAQDAPVPAEGIEPVPTPLKPAPAVRSHPWIEFATQIRRQGRLSLTPYGVGWEETWPVERPGAEPVEPPIE